MDNKVVLWDAIACTMFVMAILLTALLSLAIPIAIIVAAVIVSSN